EDPLHERNEVARVTRVGVPRFLLLHDGHGYFGQVIHHQIVDGSATNLTYRGFEPVTPEALPGGHPNDPFAHRIIDGVTGESPPSLVQVFSSVRAATTARGKKPSPKGQGFSGMLNRTVLVPCAGTVIDDSPAA